VSKKTSQPIASVTEGLIFSELLELVQENHHLGISYRGHKIVIDVTETSAIVELDQYIHYEYQVYAPPSGGLPEVPIFGGGGCDDSVFDAFIGVCFHIDERLDSD